MPFKYVQLSKKEEFPTIDPFSQEFMFNLEKVICCGLIWQIRRNQATGFHFHPQQNLYLNQKIRTKKTPENLFAFEPEPENQTQKQSEMSKRNFAISLLFMTRGMSIV